MSPSLRAGLLISAGTALMMVPFAAELQPAAIVTGVVVGVITVALGVAGTDSQGRGTLPVSAQAASDRGLALGLLAVGILFGLNGDQGSLLVFGGAGLGALLVTLTTRYSVGQY
jgi:hypothetical protein